MQSKAQATEKREATVVQQDKGFSKGHNTSFQLSTSISISHFEMVHQDVQWTLGEQYLSAENTSRSQLSHSSEIPILLAKAFVRMHAHKSLAAQIMCKIFQKLNDECRKAPREVNPEKNKKFELNSPRSKLKPDEGFNLIYSGCDCRYRALCEDYVLAV